MMRGHSITFMVLTALVLTLSGQSVAQERNKNEDLVVIEYERWVNTIKGKLKNFNSELARDLTIVITFRDGRGLVIGHETESLGDLPSGESTSFSIPIKKQEHLEAARFTLRPIAIWPSGDKP